MRLYRRGELREYKIKSVLLFNVLCLLAATKTFFKRNKDTVTVVHDEL